MLPSLVLAVDRRPTDGIGGLAEGIVTHLRRTPVDVTRARTHANALAACGWTTQQMPAAEDWPDSVFIARAVGSDPPRSGSPQLLMLTGFQGQTRWYAGAGGAYCAHTRGARDSRTDLHKCTAVPVR